MTRPSETAGARWDEIDRDKQLWNIPAERMKKGRPHTVPLTAQTLALLETIDSITGDSEYILPADKTNKKHTNKETANKTLQRMGFKGRQTSHGLRALASTTLNEQSFDSFLKSNRFSFNSINKINLNSTMELLKRAQPQSSAYKI